MGGDVPGLETETQNCVTESSSKPRRFKGKTVCHRITLDTVAQDLSTFTRCKVLLSCIADAVEAAQQAYKAGIPHRNLSTGSIMIVEDKETQARRGILIDWDMCLLRRQRKGKPRTGRIGTWAFTSAQILENEGTITHTLWDDIESAFWVLIHGALLYLKHLMHPRILSKQMRAIFSDWTFLRPGLVVGGHEKVKVLLFCSIGRSEWSLSKLVSTNF
ncbi:hypothetical protein BYT27DRAFT_7119028 [Phlegmacium glaucopus]|nr:hypothetical protein BYT27DRAFT_7119028 [Phlegmacium glaucopus]